MVFVMREGGMPSAGSSSGYLAAERQRLGVTAGPTPMAQQGPVVFAAPQTRVPTPNSPDRPYQVVDRPATKSVTDLMLEFEEMSNKEKRKVAKRLALGGFFSDSPRMGESLEEFIARKSLGEVIDAYGRLLSEASGRFMSAGQQITPEALLQQYIDYNQGQGGGLFGKGSGSGEPEPFTGTKKYTQTNIDIYSPTQARAVIRQVLMAELGREPTEDEFADFRDALNDEARENPTTTTQRTRYEEGEAVSSTSRTRGGVDAGEVATQWAQSQPGWAEWQAVGYYFPEALNALGAGVGGV